MTILNDGKCYDRDGEATSFCAKCNPSVTTPQETCKSNPRRYHTPMFKVTKSMFSQGSITCKNMCHHIQ